MANKGAQRGQGATDSGLKPGGHPLGSVESRVTARSMLEAREATGEPGVFIRITKIGVPVDPGKCTCKRPKAGTFALCRCFMDGPNETTRSTIID
jgi:hypothetical protein